LFGLEDHGIALEQVLILSQEFSCVAGSQQEQ